MITRVRLFNLCALAAATAVLVSSGFAPRADWSPQRFPISFWCGPPESQITEAQYRRIVAAGFTHLMPPCEGRSTPDRNRKILDMAQKVGLKAFVQDERLPWRITGEPGAQARIEAVVKDYKNHPAFAGYFVFDEPSEFRFAGLGEVVKALKKLDPKHTPYLNLYPNYVSLDDLGTVSYEAHVRQFLDQIPVDIVSYDHYPLLESGIRPGYFPNLDLIRRVASERNLPFWQIIQLTQHGQYREVTEADLRWQAMLTLAYGAKGLMFFTYCTPTDTAFKWGQGMLDLAFEPTKRYSTVQKVNVEVSRIGDALLPAQRVAVFHVGVAAAPPPPDGIPIQFRGQGAVVVGVFRHGSTFFALVVNRSPADPTSVDVRLDNVSGQMDYFDAVTGKWRLHAKSVKPGDPIRFELTLPAGGAALYRW